MNKTVIIGLDGVPPGVLQDYIDSGFMPHLSDYIGMKGMERMESSIPAISNVSWTTMFTGANPGVHGIFGFTDFIKDSYHLRYPNRNTIQTSPYWWSGKNVVINMPGTFPPVKRDGVLIAGFVALDIDRAVRPSSLIPTLKSMKYQVDVDVSSIEQSTQLFYTQLSQVLLKRKHIGLQLYKQNRWETFTFIVTGTDRLLHYQWNERFGLDALKYMREVDETIQQFMQDDTQLILLSDHGMTGIEQRVNINQVIREHGLDDVVKALDPGRLYLHTDARFPQGHRISIAEEDALIECFKNLQYKGKQVIQDIVPCSEVYAGPYVGYAPDWVLIPYDGFNLYCGKDTQVFHEPDRIKGMHTQDAFVSVRMGEPPVSIQGVRSCIMH